MYYLCHSFLIHTLFCASVYLNESLKVYSWVILALLRFGLSYQSVLIFLKLNSLKYACRSSFHFGLFWRSISNFLRLFFLLTISFYITLFGLLCQSILNFLRLISSYPHKCQYPLQERTSSYTHSYVCRYKLNERGTPVQYSYVFMRAVCHVIDTHKS